ncbi:LamG-like jellyroll fold domain-containing protein [Planctomycetota bacterium]
MRVSFVPLVVSLMAINLGAAPLEDHLIAQWQFDVEGGGVVWDDSGHGLHGTAYEVTLTPGITGLGAVFDSVRDEIHIPARGETPPVVIGDLAYGSISVWFKFQNVGAKILPILYFGESEMGTKHNSLIIEIGHANNANNRKLYFTIINQRFCYDSGVNLVLDKWYHFVAVVGPEGNTGYLNGEEMTRRHYNLGSDETYTDFFASVPVKEMLAIGYGRFGQQDPFFHFKGTIDDVRIYDRAISLQEAGQLFREPSGPVLTYEDVTYGPHERNVLDFWQAPSVEPTPLVVFIHGGGFRSGDKRSIRNSSGLNEIATYHESGVSFAAINYRFRMTTTLDEIMLDCARAIQFIRSQAKAWNIDPNRIAAYGGSAGGGASLWLGMHDDLADPNSEDPILRESSRLAAVGHNNSQATYDFVQWADILQVDLDWMETYSSHEDLDLYGITDRSQLYDPEIVAMRAFLDMPAFMDANDPPLYTNNTKPNIDPTNANAIIHHPRHAIYLRDLCDIIGLPCVVVLDETPKEERVRIVDFFLEQLLHD